MWKWEWFISGNAVVMGCFEGAELCQGAENKLFNIDISEGVKGNITTKWLLFGRIKMKDERLKR
ncbi:MAG: hypothetical protein P8Y60_09110 [Calditrichota bacterium]